MEKKKIKFRSSVIAEVECIQRSRDSANECSTTCILFNVRCRRSARRYMPRKSVRSLLARSGRSSKLTIQTDGGSHLSSAENSRLGARIEGFRWREKGDYSFPEIQREKCGETRGGEGNLTTAENAIHLCKTATYELTENSSRASSGEGKGRETRDPR